ncbi:hypothetical protein U9M48_025077 [Paspalum notatum var. saurae]|uniref:Uncharacterized protein n=1 Tax=Paspalum notatum var. saurae TaxID=547442 RepID=A0AAQ3TSJ6_PASNO
MAAAAPRLAPPPRAPLFFHRMPPPSLPRRHPAPPLPSGRPLLPSSRPPWRRRLHALDPGLPEPDPAATGGSPPPALPSGRPPWRLRLHGQPHLPARRFSSTACHLLLARSTSPLWTAPPPLRSASMAAAAPRLGSGPPRARSRRHGRLSSTGAALRPASMAAAPRLVSRAVPPLLLRLDLLLASSSRHHGEGVDGLCPSTRAREERPVPPWMREKLQRSDAIHPTSAAAVSSIFGGLGDGGACPGVEPDLPVGSVSGATLPSLTMEAANSEEKAAPLVL